MNLKNNNFRSVYTTLMYVYVYMCLFIESFVSIWMLPLQLTLTTYLSFSHSFSSLFLYFPFHPNRSQSERRPLESGSAPGFFLQGGFSSQLWPLTCSVGLVSFSYVQNALRRLRKWFTAWRIKKSVDWLTDILLHLQRKIQTFFVVHWRALPWLHFSGQAVDL